jgi:hypothetical protein
VITAEKIAQALACGEAGCKCGQKSGGGYLTHCPAHLDETPSLSVSDQKGKLLVKCFGGCHQEVVIEALRVKGLWATKESSKSYDAAAPAGLTLSEFAKAKQLDSAFLATHGVFQAIGKGGPYLVFTYRDHENREIKEAVRFRFSMAERPKSKKGGRPVLYGLWRLPEFLPGGELIVVEGESDSLTAWSYDLPIVGIPGKTLLKTLTPAYFSAFHTIYVWQEPDAPELPGQVAARLPGITVKALVPPQGIKDISEVHIKGEDVPALITRLMSEAQVVTPATAPIPEVPPTEAGSKPTQTELLIGYASEAELFHDQNHKGYAAIPVGGHFETWPVKSTAFRDWLRCLFYKANGKPPGGQALQDTLDFFAAQARFDGQEHEVHVRVAHTGGRLYVDLANDGWQAVEVSPKGWKVVDRPPVKFRRPRGLAPLPMPNPGGSLDDLRPFVNCREEDWPLIVAWILGAFSPGPYPAMIFQGEQGSAKSTTARILKSLVDPSHTPQRAAPREIRDLMISAANSWCLSFDNLSHLKDWLSDGFCRLATGGGLSTRELYSDADETILDAMRPLILNGIDSLVSRADLADRAILLELPRIGDDGRQREVNLWQAFEKVSPGILGAIFTALSAAMENITKVKLPRLPRMADFATWVVAAEPALPWPPGAFLAAYIQNRAAVVEHSLESDPVAVVLRKFMESREEWEGTATELLGELSDVAGDLVSRSKAWPKAANSLSNRLRRASTFLRASGIEIDWEENSRPRIVTLRKGEQKTVETVGTVQSEKPCGFAADDTSDDNEGLDGPTVGTVQGPSARKTGRGKGLDEADDADDEKQPFSKTDWELSLEEVDL